MATSSNRSAAAAMACPILPRDPITQTRTEVAATQNPSRQATFSLGSTEMVARFC